MQGNGQLRQREIGPAKRDTKKGTNKGTNKYMKTHSFGSSTVSSKLAQVFFGRNGGDDESRTRDLCRDRVAWLGFTTTYKTAGTAKLRGSHIRRKFLWAGLWVGKSPQTPKQPHFHFPEPLPGYFPTIRELSPSGSNRGSVTAVSRSVDGFPSFPGDERHEGQGRDLVCPRRVKDQVCQQSCQSDQ
jgi:hypothetical protein